MASTNTNLDAALEEHHARFDGIRSDFRRLQKAIMVSVRAKSINSEVKREFSEVVTKYFRQDEVLVELLRKKIASALASGSMIQLNRFEDELAAYLVERRDFHQKIVDSPIGDPDLPQPPQQVHESSPDDDGDEDNRNVITETAREEEAVSRSGEGLTIWRDHAALMASADEADRTLMVQELTAGGGYNEELGGCRISEADLEKEVDGYMEVSSLVRDDPENAVELLRVMTGSASATDALIRLRGREEEQVAHYIHLSNHREEVVQMFRYDLGLSSDPPPPPAYLVARWDEHIAVLERQVAQCDEMLCEDVGYKHRQLQGKILQSRVRSAVLLKEIKSSASERAGQLRELMGHKSPVSETPNDGGASSAPSIHGVVIGRSVLAAWMIRLLKPLWDESDEDLDDEGMIRLLKQFWDDLDEDSDEDSDDEEGAFVLAALQSMKRFIIALIEIDYTYHPEEYFLRIVQINCVRPHTYHTDDEYFLRIVQISCVVLDSSDSASPAHIPPHSDDRSII